MSKEDFLIESVEGTISMLDKVTQGDKELMQIFEAMTKDQLYAVSSVISMNNKFHNDKTF